MNKKQFGVLLIIVYLGIGFLNTQSFEQGQLAASHGQNNMTTKYRISHTVLWPILCLHYLGNGYPNTYSAFKD